MDRITGELPGGWWDGDGVRHRVVELRCLTGDDEELLAGSAGTVPAALVTTVLARCLLRIGGLSPVPAALVRGLVVADRDYLMLLLRRLTFGDRFVGELLCPWPDCGERVSLQLAVSDVPVHPSPCPSPVHTTEVDGVEVAFRLPDGGDQEELSPWAARDEAGALRALLRRCVLRIGEHEPPGDERVDTLGPRARAAVEAAMEAAAPRVERTVDVGCAACGRVVVAPIEVQRFFFGELRADGDLLYREVHRLAMTYHWSEADILALPRGRRLRYLDLIGEEPGRLVDGA